jgi:hypothetical protein
MDAWVAPFTKAQPRVMLHGISVEMCACGCGDEDLLVPNMDVLLGLAEEHPECMEFSWDDRCFEWHCMGLN